MPRSWISAALFLFAAVPLFAENPHGSRWRVSILASEIAQSSNDAWSKADDAGLGVGVAYAPGPQWDVELTVSQKTHVSRYFQTMAIPIDPPLGYQLVTVFDFREYRVRPVDFSVTRHFLAGQPIAPYVRGGVRYVEAPSDSSQPMPIFVGPEPRPIAVNEGFRLTDRTSAQLGAGVRIRLTPRTALRTEVTRLVRSDAVDFDPLTRFSAGVSWAF